MKTTADEKLIIYFDGVCGLCNRFVDFIIARDKKDRFRFLPLQSKRAAQKLPSSVNLNDPDSVVLEYRGKFYFKSQAVLLALPQLGGFYTLWMFANLVPSVISDKFYDFVAARRYAWFGKAESCRLPSVEEKHKFLEDMTL